MIKTTKQILDDINEYEENAVHTSENGTEYEYGAPEHICDDHEWIPVSEVVSALQKLKDFTVFKRGRLNRNDVEVHISLFEERLGLPINSIGKSETANR